jgi:hypothetical protein
MNNMESHMIYHFQGFRFEFVQDELLITNQRHFPYFEVYKMKFTESDIPFIISVEQKGRVDND